MIRRKGRWLLIESLRSYCRGFFNHFLKRLYPGSVFFSALLKYCCPGDCTFLAGAVASKPVESLCRNLRGPDGKIVRFSLPDCLA